MLNHENFFNFRQSASPVIPDTFGLNIDSFLNTPRSLIKESSPLQGEEIQKVNDFLYFDGDDDIFDYMVFNDPVSNVSMTDIEWDLMLDLLTAVQSNKDNLIEIEVTDKNESVIRNLLSSFDGAVTPNSRLGVHKSTLAEALKIRIKEKRP